MFQKGAYAESSTLSTLGSYPQSDSSLSDRVTATIIREEAAEVLLPGIQGDAELVALVQVLNRYKAQWWLKHLSRVGGDPETYWRAQLGAEIRAATRGKKSTSQKEKFPGWFFRRFTTKYELCHLDLDPL